MWFHCDPVNVHAFEALSFEVQVRLVYFPVPLRTPCGGTVREGRDGDLPGRCWPSSFPVGSAWFCAFRLLISLPWRHLFYI